MPTIRVAARPLNLAHYVGRIRATRKQGEKESRIFGIRKRKLDTIANMTSLVTVAEGIVESVVQVIQGISKWFSEKRVLLKGHRFTKSFNYFRLPFTFLSGGVSLYLGAQDAAALRVAYREGDGEALRDRTLNLTSNTTNLSASTIGSTIGILQIKGVKAGVASLGVASAALMLVAFTIYTLIEGIGLARCARAVGRMKETFASKEENGLSQYQRAMKDLAERVGISRAEEVMLQEKSKDWSYGDAFFKEADKLLIKKEKILERRVGKEMTEMIKQDAFNILQGLNSSDFKERTLALFNADRLLKKYKASLYKSLTSRVINCTAGVIGCVGGIVALANPVGASATAAALVAAASGLILYAYYGECYWKESQFRNGLKVFNRTVSNFKLPDIRSIMDREIMNVNQSKDRNPREMLAILRKRREFKACA